MDDPPRQTWEPQSRVETFYRTAPPPEDIQAKALRLSEEQNRKVLIVERADGEYEVRATEEPLT